MRNDARQADFTLGRRITLPGAVQATAAQSGLSPSVSQTPRRRQRDNAVERSGVSPPLISDVRENDEAGGVELISVPRAGLNGKMPSLHGD